MAFSRTTWMSRQQKGNKSSAVAEMGDRLTTRDISRKVGKAAVGALGPHWVTI